MSVIDTPEGVDGRSMPAEERNEIARSILSHPGIATAAEALALAVLNGEITPPVRR